MEAAASRARVSATQRRFTSPHDLTPRTHLLSNGRYSVMITAAGSGYSRWGNFAVTRWREDVTCDNWGTYVFLRDTRSGELWSAGYQPSGAEPDRYEVAFSEGRAEIVRHDGTFTTTLEVAVSSEDDAEVRRVSITNLGSHVREIELTSYAEIVLAPHAADDAHPAFSKLFVETEFVAEVGAILATRRPRSPGDAQVWAAHLAVVEGETVGDVQFETDRARFLGRGRGVRRPLAMVGRTPLSNTAGTVLDPIFSLRRRVRIQPQATARVAFWTLVAPLAQRSARSCRQASRGHGVRPRGHARLDPGASAASSSGHQRRRSACLSAPRQSRALFRPDAAAAVRHAQAGRGRGIDALAARDLRRPADRPGPHRRSRGYRYRPATAARARILADEAFVGRSRDLE